MHRLTFDVDNETHHRLQIIPRGSRNRCLRMIVERVAVLIEEQPAETIAKILTAALTKKDIIG